MKNSVLIMIRVFVFLALAMFFILPARAADAPTAPAPAPVMPDAAMPHVQTKTTLHGTAEGGERVPPDVPLDQPNIEPTALVPLMGVWVNEAMNLQPDTYQETLRTASRNFTKPGWATFTKSLQRAKIISTLLTEGQTLAIETGAPNIVREGNVDGRYQWVVSVPITISYYSIESQMDRRTIAVTVVRVPKKVNVMGLSIDEWIISD